MLEQDIRQFSIGQLRGLELMIAPLRVAITVAPLWLIYGMFRALSQVDVSSLFQPTIWLTLALVAAGIIRTALTLVVRPDHTLFRHAVSAGHFREAVRRSGLRSSLPKPTRLFALKLIDLAVVTPTALILMIGFLAWGHHIMSLLTIDEPAPAWLMWTFGWVSALLFVGIVLFGTVRMVFSVRCKSEEGFRVASILSPRS
ncbi:hypothetical protein SAMN02982989_0030 [Xaviernesmea oryzae]|uniref:Uncharacterized protein n=1 Tax=Xaviernesmea oryzae TaxID=464029 RepID=A0A1X7DXL3_9HYPH|nr:hypothetical protein [Xaviernesmea oryzae]SMF23076.1 hypothetical protein SAMN02982989_0030 [Xaviernesmea oryzae]